MKKIIMTAIMAATVITSFSSFADSYVCNKMWKLTYASGHAVPESKTPKEISAVVSEGDDQVQVRAGGKQFFFPKIEKNIYAEGNTMVSKNYKNGGVYFSILSSSKPVLQSQMEDMVSGYIFGGCETGSSL